MPKVSVVIGIYNGAEKLQETLDSVLKQDFEDFELIAVDDGSSDARVQTQLVALAAADKRLLTLRQERNQGLTQALIAGCRAARGDFIARIDAGDVMAPRRLGKQLEVLQNYPDCVLVSSWCEFFGPHWEPLWVNRGYPAMQKPLAVLAEQPAAGLLADIPHHGSVMFRSFAYHAVGGYRAEFYFGQDWDLWYRLAEIGSYYIVPDILYRARIFPDAISQLHKSRQDRIAACAKAAFVARRRNESEASHLRTAATFRLCQQMLPRLPRDHEPGYYFIGEALRRNRDQRCRGYLRDAIKAAPLRPRAYVRWLQSWF